VATEEGTANGGPALAARYSAAFAAYLANRGEQALGAAYDLGREAVAARLSVLDLAEAHHGALRAALGGHPPSEATLQASADFLRESLSTFESVHRGYLEVQKAARLEHEHVEQLRALAKATVAINSSLTVEEILQLTADTARSIIGAGRATVSILPDPWLRPLTATSPPHPGRGEPEPARLTVALQRRGRELGEQRTVVVDAALDHPGVVDEDVDRPRGRDERERLLAVGQVGNACRDDVGAVRAELAGALLDPYGRRGDRDARAEPREQTRGRETDPFGAPAAGDEREAARQVERTMIHPRDGNGDGASTSRRRARSSCAGRAARLEGRVR
jgi:hypothetical protein